MKHRLDAWLCTQVCRTDPESITWFILLTWLAFGLWQQSLWAAVFLALATFTAGKVAMMLLERLTEDENPYTKDPYA